MILFSLLIVVLDTFVRSHQTVDLKGVHFTLCVKTAIFRGKKWRREEKTRVKDVHGYLLFATEK